MLRGLEYWSGLDVVNTLLTGENAGAGLDARNGEWAWNRPVKAPLLPRMGLLVGVARPDNTDAAVASA